MSDFVETPKWVCGDATGRDFPSSPQVLHEHGRQFLAEILQAADWLSAEHAPIDIQHCNLVDAGSTGQKCVIQVSDRTGANLPPLFCKFSRATYNQHRDAARIQMASEVRLALLSRHPAFPITVPRVVFADYEERSGTGVLITEAVDFSAPGIQAPFEKYRDDAIDTPVKYYQAVLDAIGTLAGTHQSGALGVSLDQDFPFSQDKLAINVSGVCTPDEAVLRVKDLAQFMEDFPQLFPASLTSGKLIENLYHFAPRVLEQRETLIARLFEQPEHIALCHWNAHLDNAWFWQDDEILKVGLFDWGHVGQMNLGMALWGSLSGARPELWDEHFELLLTTFCDAVQRAGGQTIDPARMALQMDGYIALMGLDWLLDTPSRLRATLETMDGLSDAFDPRIHERERIRSPLGILTLFLHLWMSRDFARLAEEGSSSVEPAP
jgi:hypothetical protein